MKLYQIAAGLDFSSTPGVLGYEVDPRLFKNHSDAQKVCDELNKKIEDDWENGESEYENEWNLSCPPEWTVIELDTDTAI